MRVGFHSPRRGAAVWCGVVVLAATGGCELLVDRSAALVDAGPDAVAHSCMANGCVECEPVVVSGCPATDGGGADADTGSAGGCAGGGDCDAVPDPRDPWPQRCNALLLQESFAKPLADERWGRSYGDLHIHVKPCGLLEWTASPYHTIWTWLTEEAAAGLPPDALVELRILPRLRGDWTVTLAFNLTTTSSSSMYGSTTQGRFCLLEHDLPGKAGYFRLSSRVYHDKGYDSEYSEYTPLAGNLVLQSWIEGNTHFCRVVPESGKALQVDHEYDGSFPEQGTIRLSLVNQAQEAPYVWLWMDWLRVFAR